MNGARRTADLLTGESERKKPKEGDVSTVKDEVQSLLSKLPDDCTYEDIQYHLYVIEKIQRGIRRAETEGTLSQEEAEERFRRWTTK